MKKKQLAIIRSQARAVRKTAKYIRSLNWSLGKDKAARARIKASNGEDYDPIVAKQLALAASDTKAARLFRAYIQINPVHHPALVILGAGFDFRMLSLILLGKNKKVSRSSVFCPAIYQTQPKV